METREKITILLLLLSLILALLPLTANRSFRGSPSRLLDEVLSDETYFSSDQVAGFIVKETPDIQLFDLRPAEKYREAFIPGAVSVPYADFITSDPDIWLRDSTRRMILYSADGIESAAAMVYARGLGYDNTYFLKGGIDEWVKTISATEFEGERITAGENAILETRRRAADMYNELRSLPDSLKAKYLESKKFSARKLDGGCQ
ncbi:MAG: rhodanese-like domain-containing protein [Bacteroidales bacterium]|nr:rhodanese-like domain-containing protein [Bacteroidales bacterium]MDT8373551.1 rhodanese-like domain-containing protein [Bacteroidales bacterium]